MSKFVKYLSIVLFALSAILAVAFYLRPSGPDMEATMVEIVLYYAYVLFFLAIVLALVLPLFSLLDNPKKFKKLFINLAAVVVVFGFGYLFASSDPLVVQTTVETTPFTLKLTDAGLIITYLLIAVSILAIFSGAVINLVRNR